MIINIFLVKIIFFKVDKRSTTIETIKHFVKIEFG